MVKGRVRRRPSSGTAEQQELGTSSQTPDWKCDVLPLSQPSEVFTHIYHQLISSPKLSTSVKSQKAVGESGTYVLLLISN